MPTRRRLLGRPSTLAALPAFLALLLAPAASVASAASPPAHDAAAELARAGALAARQDWQAALGVLEEIGRRAGKAGAPPPPGTDLQLAIVYRHLGRGAESLAALERAVASGLPPAQAALHRARLLARRGEVDGAIDEIIKAAGAGFGNVLALTQDAELRSLGATPRWPEAVAAVDRNQRPCLHDAAFRGFDFWIGEWDVTAAASPGAAPATSSIQLVLEGCALAEHYVNGGYSGRSLTFWDPARRRWQQTYVDSTATVLEFHGGFEGNRLVLLGETPGAGPGQPATRQRIAWEPRPDGTVRQVWDQSSDDGVTWSTVFDGTYTRKQARATPR